MAPGGDFLARLFLGDAIVDEVDYRNQAANRAWRQAGRDYRAQRDQGLQVPEEVLPARPFHAPQGAGGSSSHSKRTTQEKGPMVEVIREPRDKTVSRRQTVRGDEAREPRPRTQVIQPPVRRETVSHHSDRKKAQLEAPRRPEQMMDIHAIGKYGGVSPRVTMQRQDPGPAERKSSSKATRQSSHRGGPVGFPEQLEQACHAALKRNTHGSRSHNTSTRGNQNEDYHGIPVVEIKPRGSRRD